MSKMGELDSLLTGLSEYSRRIEETVQGVRALLSESESLEETPAAAGTPASAEAASAVEAPEAKKAFTLEEVRAVLLEKRKAGFRDEIKSLLVRHGADRLTEIDPAEYEAMMREAGDIGA